MKNYKNRHPIQFLTPGINFLGKNRPEILQFEKIWNKFLGFISAQGFIWPKGGKKVAKNVISYFFKVNYFRCIFVRTVHSRCQNLILTQNFLIFGLFYGFSRIKIHKCVEKKVFPIFQKWIVPRLFWANFSEYWVKKSTGCKDLPENGDQQKNGPKIKGPK